MGYGEIMSVVLEPMAGRHVDAVSAIDSRCFSRPWSAAQWRTELTAADRTHLVARDSDQVVAHAGTLRVLDELHVTTVAVDPDHEGKGHGTRLCIELLRLGIAAGATAATLEVRAQAHRTQRLYSRLGFAPAGIRSRYYDRPTDDAVIMWLHDLDSPEIVERLDRVAAELLPISDGAAS
ncbi:MAG: ribosomal-protein-alanine N-acetyltransferase [Acidimicrobiaceae bacterium]|nr:ribosomal-protein-alanine N-acetyltransferase [Acidimicrobiaceae bacterium]